MYGKITKSMQLTIEETNRKKQIKYNINGLTLHLEKEKENLITQRLNYAVNDNLSMATEDTERLQ